MLIRNAVISGCMTDLRLMHGRVQEIGVGLVKGLYESALDLAGDELRPLTADMLPALPLRYVRFRRAAMRLEAAHIIPGTSAPLTRWRNGELIECIDEHAAD